MHFYFWYHLELKSGDQIPETKASLGENYFTSRFRQSVLKSYHVVIGISGMVVGIRARCKST